MIKCATLLTIRLLIYFIKTNKRCDFQCRISKLLTLELCLALSPCLVHYIRLFHSCQFIQCLPSNSRCINWVSQRRELTKKKGFCLCYCFQLELLLVQLKLRAFCSLSGQPPWSVCGSRFCRLQPWHFSLLATIWFCLVLGIFLQNRQNKLNMTAK